MIYYTFLIYIVFLALEPTNTINFKTITAILTFMNNNTRITFQLIITSISISTIKTLECHYTHLIKSR